MNNSDVLKLEIAEVEENSLGPEYSDVDVMHISRNATREGRNIFEVFREREREREKKESIWSQASGDGGLTVKSKGGRKKR